MKISSTLVLTEDDLRKLTVLLRMIPYEATQKLPVEIRKFHQELYEITKDIV